jgi:hypothetical protein
MTTDPTVLRLKGGTQHMPRYCIQYEAFADPEWTIETHTLNADDVRIVDGIAHFRDTDSDEAFLVPAGNLIAAWTNGD